MSAFDRLERYRADKGKAKESFFDAVHRLGYAMYESDGSDTELHTAIAACGNQCVNAVAGSGKTTMLTLKIIHDIVTGEACVAKTLPNGNTVRVVDKMWVCTFLRTGAADLKSSLEKWQSDLGYVRTADQITFSTLDAEFKRCLNAMGVATPLASQQKLDTLFRKAVDTMNIKRSDGTSLVKEDYKILQGLVTYARSRLTAKYNHASMEDYCLTPTMLDMLLQQFAELRSAEGVMDFEEMMELLYRYLYVTPNRAVQDFVANRYSYIYIDEFQDTSQIAYAILRFYARGFLWMNRDGQVHTEPEYNGYEAKGKIVVIGDVSQTIYSFRGSDRNILGNEFDRDFRPVVSTLSVNWRCPSNILDPVVPSIHKNFDSCDQRIVAAKDGGELHVYTFHTMKKMLEKLKEGLIRDAREGLTSAILCRTNYDGVVPALMLEAMGKFDFSISGDGMTMNTPLARRLLKVSSLFTERTSASVKDSLSFFVGRNTWHLTQMMDALKTSGMGIWEIPEEDIKYSCPMILPVIQMCKKVMFVDGVRDRDRDLDAFRTVLGYMLVETFSYDSAFCWSARSYIETILSIMDERDFKTIYDMINEFEYMSDRLEGRIKKNNVSIRIATVHEFKGKECDSVYIWNDSENVFPSGKCDEEDDELIDEERRIHYIACTRARKYESIYCRSGKVGMFVKEMDVKLETASNPSRTL